MKINSIKSTLAQRIKSRLDKLGKSERRASLEAGLSDSFLRNIRQNKSSSPRIDTLEKIAEVLETNPAWLMTGAGEEELSLPAANILPEPAPRYFPPAEPAAVSAIYAERQPPENNRDLPILKPGARRMHRQKSPRIVTLPGLQPGYDGFHESDGPSPPISPSPYPSYDLFQGEEAATEHIPNALIGKKFSLNERRLPVYGQAVGGIDGEFPINGSTLYSVLCPPQLSEISGAYAVSISGDSMYPRYEDGEIAFVDPTRRVKKGDYVIAQIATDETEIPLAYVKKFICHNAGGLVLEQFNPAKELHFPHERVVSVHYIALAGTAPV
ncbi:hypothetical protein DPQ22_03935 [Candidatus Tokpelaia sp.]|nr:S24 family peptidase [Candidatus Tokpelaia sp.]KAA6405592.1 hypothetical protein DPQ22_03935 [Candidatus Tokpelaia sp.]